MKIRHLRPEQVPAGTRVRVTRVAVDDAERKGFVNDSERLTGQTGTVESLNPGDDFAQLYVKWDTPGMSLGLASDDAIQILPGPYERDAIDQDFDRVAARQIDAQNRRAS